MDVIKELRKEKGLTIRQLQNLTGISNAYLSQIENGKRGLPSVDFIIKLYGPLGVPFAEMMEKAGYVAYSDSHTRIKELEGELIQANERIRELENIVKSISQLTKQV